MAQRDFDLVIYGATGFVGRRAARELAAHADAARVRWAIAGRDRAKLEALAREIGGPEVIVAGADDAAAIGALAARTRVVLAMAGPFTTYADALVAACVRTGTHYADITGETPWVRTLIDRFDAAAREGRTRIVPGCGFDSVPSDLGAYLVDRAARVAFGDGVRDVRAWFTAAGGFNGGTLATFALITGDAAMRARYADPDALTPPALRTDASAPSAADPRVPTYDARAKAWLAPFLMGAINTRVVRRSVALELAYGERARPFAYQEYLRVGPSPLGFAAAAGVSLAMAAGMAALVAPPTRGAVLARLPAPGAGPTEKTMAGGWFRCELAGTAPGGTVRGVVAAKGDPGNVATSTFALESALALALDGERLPGGPSRGGLLTPATALGEVLVERLRARGMTLEATATAG